MIEKQNFVIEYFDVVLFMKQRRNKKKETETMNQKKAKKKYKKEERKEKERDRERASEKGGAQERLRRNKGRHSKINKNAPFRGKTEFFNEKTKKGKE